MVVGAGYHNPLHVSSQFTYQLHAAVNLPPLLHFQGGNCLFNFHGPETNFPGHGIQMKTTWQSIVCIGKSPEINGFVVAILSIVTNTIAASGTCLGGTPFIGYGVKWHTGTICVDVDGATVVIIILPDAKNAKGSFGKGGTVIAGTEATVQ